jgi:hypothetical protein
VLAPGSALVGHFSDELFQDVLVPQDALLRPCLSTTRARCEPLPLSPSSTVCKGALPETSPRARIRRGSMAWWRVRLSVSGTSARVDVPEEVRPHVVFSAALAYEDNPAAPSQQQGWSGRSRLWLAHSAMRAATGLLRLPCNIQTPLPVQALSSGGLHRILAPGIAPAVRLDHLYMSFVGAP